MAQNCATRIEESIYMDDRGKEYRKFHMNRDGFSLLAMGFTGKNALQWKLDYIKLLTQWKN